MLVHSGDVVREEQKGLLLLSLRLGGRYRTHAQLRDQPARGRPFGDRLGELRSSGLRLQVAVHDQLKLSRHRIRSPRMPRAEQPPDHVSLTARDEEHSKGRVALQEGKYPLRSTCGSNPDYPVRLLVVLPPAFRLAAVNLQDPDLKPVGDDQIDDDSNAVEPAVLPFRRRTAEPAKQLGSDGANELPRYTDRCDRHDRIGGAAGDLSGDVRVERPRSNLSQSHGGLDLIQYPP